jgi:hypothetical protein
MNGWASKTYSVKGVAGDSCNCIGPQQGFPKCPCMMRGLIQRNGRWIEPEKDLGPIAAKEGS